MSATAAPTALPVPESRGATVERVQTSPPGRFVRWWRELGWRHVVGIVAVLFALFPAVWAFSASINPTSALSAQKLIPDHPSLENYRKLLDNPDQPFMRWFYNTMIIAAATAFFTVFIAALAAFAFSRLRFRGRRVGLMTLLLVQMFPQLLLIVPLYLMMLNIGSAFPAIGLGTKAGIIVVYLGGAMGGNVWLMKGFFDTLPRELDESAKVDGASHAAIYFRIILPLAAPILAVIFLFSFIFTLNEYVVASVLLRGSPSDFTLAYGLQQFINTRSARWGIFAAGAMIESVPVVGLFFFLQRYLVSGLTSGAVKG